MSITPSAVWPFLAATFSGVSPSRLRDSRLAPFSSSARTAGSLPRRAACSSSALMLTALCCAKATVCGATKQQAASGNTRAAPVNPVDRLRPRIRLAEEILARVRRRQSPPECKARGSHPRAVRRHQPKGDNHDEEHQALACNRTAVLRRRARARRARVRAGSEAGAGDQGRRSAQGHQRVAGPADQGRQRLEELAAYQRQLRADPVLPGHSGSTRRTFEACGRCSCSRPRWSSRWKRRRS